MMNHEHKRPVTLEDLLRLKRTERPPAEFWVQFDRELRAKQLAALVEKRPWWRSFPAVLAVPSRLHLPLGATAILAVTFLTVREYRHAVPAPSANPGVNAMTAVAAAPVAPVATGGAGPATAVREAVSARSVVLANDDETPAAPGEFVLSSEATAPGHLSQMIPLLGVASRGETGEQESTPTARFIAANLALAKATEPAVIESLLGASRGFEARAMPPRPPVVEPLAQMAPPTEAKRSRLLNGAVMSVSMNQMPPARSTDRAARRLTDQELYDTISRFDARGNSLLVKF